MKNPIGVFDSGIGGLSILKELIRILPNEDFIYYADSLNNPYGSKDSDELVSIVSNVVDVLISKCCRLIVIACNTATTVAIKELRIRYPDIVFVGVVPAIKVACDYNSINTLVLATPYTIKSKRVDELVATYKHIDQTITLVPCHYLAKTIEFGTEKEIDKVLEDQLREYTGKDYDTVVLGCTHYSLIKGKIKKWFPSSEIIDGNIGVANEVKRQLQKHGYLKNNNEYSHIEFINSQKDLVIDYEEKLKSNVE